MKTLLSVNILTSTLNLNGSATASPANVYGIVMPTADPRGGAESMLLRMLKANLIEPRTKYQIVFLEDGPMVETVRTMGYEVIVIQAGRLRQLHRFVRTVLRLRKWILQNHLTLVLSWQEKAHLYAGWAAKLAGVPAAWYLHSIQTGTGLNAWVGRTPARAVICCGEYVRQVQMQHYPTLPAITVTIAVDLDRFDPEKLPSVTNARRELGLPADRPIIGMVARLQRWKGVHVFIEAASKVLVQHPTAFFVVVGGDWWAEPAYPAELRSQVSTLGLDEHIRFIGQKSNVPVWMQAMDIVVHASHNEPAGLVIIEAMSLGKAVVAADSPGPREFAVADEEALFVKYGDCTELADKLSVLLTEPQRALKLGSNARKRAINYGADQLTRQLSSVLTSVSLNTSGEYQATMA